MHHFSLKYIIENREGRYYSFPKMHQTMRHVVQKFQKTVSGMVQDKKIRQRRFKKIIKTRVPQA
jgi:hypothetical protein